MNFYDFMFNTDVKNIVDLTETVKDLQAKINEKVVGQESAVATVAGGLFNAGIRKMTDSNRSRPLATFVFTGPSGVGKTMLAETMGSILGIPYQRFDMSAYASKDANVEFSGSDKVYNGAKPGNVTSYVKRHKESILIFDEIEKAHPVVINLFLQILDKGVLRDSYEDMDVSFKDTIIVFTTNAGKQLYSASETADLSGIPTKTVIKALETDVDPVTGVPYFPAPICSRMASGNVIMFNHIDAFGLHKLMCRQLDKKSGELKESLGINISIDEKVKSAILFSEGGKADARVAVSKASEFLNKEIYELLRLIASDDISKLKTINIVASDNIRDAEIRRLFEEKSMGEILLFASSELCDVCRSRTPGISYVTVSDEEEAKKKLRENEICAVLIDLTYQIKESAETPLNIEDAESVARDILWAVRTVSPDMPIYILDTKSRSFCEEEKTSMRSNGVQGIITLDDGFCDSINGAIKRLHCLDSMNSLARSNRIVTYETSQSISEDKTIATVEVFDFEFDTAFDPNDKDNIMSVMSLPDTDFDDVIGADDAKNELGFFAEYMNDRRKFKDCGVGVPRGVLLYGPSGTGKTMLAKAMAKKTNATFISADANSFIKGNAALGIRKVHEIFAVARKYAPSIVFIDEFDAIAKERVGMRDGSEEVLTAILTEMDGFKTDRSRLVFVLAATNFTVKQGTPKSIDAAIIRRFDRSIRVGLPSCDNRKLFLQKKITKDGTLYSLNDEQISNIAMRSVGMSLSDLDGVLEAAKRDTAREGKSCVDYAVLDNALETVTSGEKRKWDEQQLRHVAYHEAGHAIVSLEQGKMPIYLSVAAREGQIGYMQCLDDETKVLYTKEELLQSMRTILGGRGAELVYFGDDGFSTGACDDLSKATELARSMLCSFGMYSDWGIASTDCEEAGSGLYTRINEILNTATKEAMDIIEKNKEKFVKLAEALIKNHCLCEKEIQSVLEN